MPASCAVAAHTVVVDAVLLSWIAPVLSATSLPRSIPDKAGSPETLVTVVCLQFCCKTFKMLRTGELRRTGMTLKSPSTSCLDCTQLIYSRTTHTYPTLGSHTCSWRRPGTKACLFVCLFACVFVWLFVCLCVCVFVGCWCWCWCFVWVLLGPGVLIWSPFLLIGGPFWVSVSGKVKLRLFISDTRPKSINL